MANIIPSYSKNSRAEMLDFIINHPETSLEVGCREGLFSQLIKEKYNDVTTWGIEIDPRVSRDSALKNIDHFISEPYPDCIENFADQKFDLVIFNDVLEHIYDPWHALRETKRILSDSGIIIVSLPNIRYKRIIKDLVFRNEFEYESSGILDISHIRFFTTKSMERMFTECGFSIIKRSALTEHVPFHKHLQRVHRYLFNAITLNHFSSMYHQKYAFTLVIDPDNTQ